MIRIISLLTFLFFSILSMAQVSETRTIAEFSKLKVATGVEVTFTQGPLGKATVQADDNEKLQDIVTKIVGNTLEIYVDSKNFGRNDKKDKKKFSHKVLKVAVSSPSVNEFKASSSGVIILENGVTAKTALLDVSSSASISGNVKADELTLDLSSSGTIESIISTNKLDAKLSSSSFAKLEGKADNASIKTSSSAELNGKKVTSKTAKIESSSSSSVSLIVTESLEAKASSSASISYYGNPAKVEAEKSSSGSVSRK